MSTETGSGLCAVDRESGRLLTHLAFYAGWPPAMTALPADSTIATHRRRLDRELDRLLDLKPTDVEGSHLRATIVVTARDKLLVFLTRRDVEATNNESERALRPSVIFRRVTNGFRSEWGAKVYADLCSVVATGRLAGRTALAVIRDALAAPAPERTAA